MNTPITVSQLSDYIKTLLERDVLLSKVVVCGELSNFKVHTTGHCYFTLKDEGAVINGVMFRGDASKLKFRPESGMKVVVSGRVSLFPKSGQYQVYVADMQPDGVGALAVAFEQLKEKLYKEGLFDKSYKQPLPRLPKRVALVTSPTGAAVQDMIRIISSRYKICEILVCPVTVQGDTGAKSIADMLYYVNEHELADVIICGRGGGSMEDLWCFNEEIVARAIFDSRIPVISAVGHEPDITIADYVADVRASTPSNAAEIVVPDSGEMMVLLREWQNKLYLTESRKLAFYKERLEGLKNSRMMSSPEAYLNERTMTVNLLENKLSNAMGNLLQQKKGQFAKSAATLDAISPLKVISRGYGMVETAEKLVKSIKDVKTDDIITVRLSDGAVKSRVLEIERE